MGALDVDRESSRAQARPEAGGRAAAATAGTGRRRGSRVIDGSLVLLFLALTFLLGIFPLKDADIYWHLRTGDLIRKTGEIPRVDFYTFTRQGTPWIDLHWMFQVGVSWLYERGGVAALTLAKCGDHHAGRLPPDHLPAQRPGRSGRSCWPGSPRSWSWGAGCTSGPRR